MALIMSVDLSMTITAAVPNPDCTSFRLSKSISTVSQISFGSKAARKRTTRNNGQQIIPTAAHAAGVLFKQFLQRNAHFFLNIARIIDVTGNAKQFGAGISFTPQSGKPATAPAANGRRNGNAFDIVHRGRAAIQAHIGRGKAASNAAGLFCPQGFQ